MKFKYLLACSVLVLSACHSDIKVEDIIKYLPTASPTPCIEPSPTATSTPTATATPTPIIIEPTATPIIVVTGTPPVLEKWHVAGEPLTKIINKDGSVRLEFDSTQFFDTSKAQCHPTGCKCCDLGHFIDPCMAKVCSLREWDDCRGPDWDVVFLNFGDPEETKDTWSVDKSNAHQLLITLAKRKKGVKVKFTYSATPKVDYKSCDGIAMKYLPNSADKKTYVYTF